MKKQRGLKRYYKNLATENDLDKATWLAPVVADVVIPRWKVRVKFPGLTRLVAIFWASCKH